MTTNYTVETYTLRAGNGRNIRKATMVTCPNGQVIRFIDLIPSKREAIAQAKREEVKGA